MRDQKTTIYTRAHQSHVTPPTIRHCHERTPGLCRTCTYFKYTIQPPPPQLIINHWHIWEQWLISLLNKRQNQSLYSSEPLHFFLAVLALPILWSLQVDSSGVCACVFVHFCVYVSGSNEAEDEADMKSIRRCQFGLILTLSCLYTLFSTHAHTRSHTLKVWMHQAYEYNHTHTQTHTPFPSTPTLSHWGLSNWGGHCQLTQFFYLPESG